MYKDFKAHLVNEIENTKKAGLYKNERIITSPQSSVIDTKNQKNIIRNNLVSILLIRCVAKHFEISLILGCL